MAYKMTHPDTSLAIKVEAEMVPTYKTQGWETAANATPPPEPAEPVVTDLEPTKPAKK